MATCDQQPTRLADSLPRVPTQTFGPLSAEDAADRRRKQEEAKERGKQLEARERAIQLEQQWQWLIGKRGSRYAGCNFGTFVLSEEHEIRERQEKALAIARDYADQIQAGRRENLILFGPKGTGKDHIMVAVLRRAAKSGVSIDWFLGSDLIKGTLSFYKDHDPTKRFVSAGLVGISDPLPPAGPLSKRESHAMLSLIDKRYSHERPIVLSVNVRNRKQLEERLGEAATDRVLEGASKAYFDWPSFRASASRVHQESPALAGSC